MSERRVIKSSKLLYDFYSWWMSVRHSHEICKVYGLCRSLEHYLDNEILYYKGLGRCIREELQAQLDIVYDTVTYPFGKDNYTERQRLHLQHLDPSRVQWVKDRIEDGMIEEEEVKEN